MNQYIDFREQYSTGQFKAKLEISSGKFRLNLYKCINIPIIGKVAYGKAVKTIDISLSRLAFAESLYISSFKQEGNFGRENRLSYSEYKAYVMNGFNENATNTPMDLMHACIGMSGELGEVQDAIKKYVFHGKPLDRIKIIEESGDFMWYLTAFFCLMDIAIADVLTANKIKLDSRYKNGRRDLMFRDTKIEYDLMHNALNGKNPHKIETEHSNNDE